MEKEGIGFEVMVGVIEESGGKVDEVCGREGERGGGEEGGEKEGGEKEGERGFGER